MFQQTANLVNIKFQDLITINDAFEMLQVFPGTFTPKLDEVNFGDCEEIGSNEVSPTFYGRITSLFLGQNNLRRIKANNLKFLGFSDETARTSEDYLTNSFKDLSPTVKQLAYAKAAFAQQVFPVFRLACH